MKKALIDPNAKVYFVASWAAPVKKGEPYTPVFEEVPNSDRVADVVDAEFPVAEPLFWLDCSDNVVANEWYYDNVTLEFVVVPPPAPYPSAGSQTL